MDSVRDRLGFLRALVFVLLSGVIVIGTVTFEWWGNERDRADEAETELARCRDKVKETEAGLRALELARDTMPLASLDELEVKAHLNPKQDLVLGCVKSDQKITVLESNIEDGTWTLTCRGRSLHWEKIDYMLRVRRCRDLLNEDL